MTAPATPQASSLAVRHSMQGNRSRDTKPEIAVRTYLRERGLTGYRLQWKKAPGRPDVAFPGRRVAIFVHGCFWHRCPYCHPSSPSTNVEFWQAKFERNQARDARDAQALVQDGWTVVVVWECRLKKRHLRRTMCEVAALVEQAGATKTKADIRPGRKVVLGRTCVHGPRGLAAQRIHQRRAASHGPRMSAASKRSASRRGRS